jgi:hypothetical protein
MKRGSSWAALVIALLTALCVGCFSFGVEHSEAKAFLESHTATVANIIQLLNQGKEQDAKELLDALHEAVVKASAVLTGLRFTGDSNTLTDPFALPAGTYRVTVRTQGYVIAKAIPLADPDDYESLFNLSSGEADGASTIYVSSGESIMLELDNIGEPWELWFEKIN